MSIRSTLAENLIRYREATGLNKSQVATKLGIVRASMTRWEQGKVAPNIEHITLLANLYSVSINELVGKKTTKKRFK